MLNQLLGLGQQGVPFIKQLLFQDIFLKDLIIILFSVKLLGYLSRKIGQPALFGKLLVGIILGPSLIGILHENLIIKKLADIGVILLMLLAGLETEIKNLQGVVLASFLTAVGGVVLPLIVGFFLALKIGFTIQTSLFIGIILVATSVSISVETLREINKLQYRESHTILGAAVLDDILGLIVLSIALNFIFNGGQFCGLGLLILKVILFFIFALLLGLFCLPLILKNIPGDIILSLVIAFIFALLAEFFGLASIIGAYLAGIFLNINKYGQKKLIEKIEILGHSFFFPIFFASIGISVNINSISGDILFLTLLGTVLAIATKIIGCGLGAFLGGFSFQGSLGIGMGMVPRGEVALIVANIGLNSGVISTDIYTSLIIITIMTTLATPILIKKAFK